mmetsp:Transcript_11947/g.15270  ORF Transcript_11947/g.15270 Transcript_11947/m.15270 type:complete len:164 (+) Transcript_11947:1-492(+)
MLVCGITIFKEEKGSMRQFLIDLLTPPRLRITNFIVYGLIVLGLILRAIVADEADYGVGRTPVYLYVVQLVLTLLFVGMLVCGELHRPAAILMCFPLLMSRVGRGAIIIILALPVTNWLDFSTVLIALIGAAVGGINIAIGFEDGPVEIKYANEGLPEDYGAA